MMAARTRGQLLAAYRAAKTAGDHDRINAILLDAIEYDATHPGESRLMDEIRVDQRLAKAGVAS